MYDVGVAGIHRLFAALETIKRSQVVVCVAGMDGALPTVVAGKEGREEGREGGRKGSMVCLLPWKRLEGRK